MASSFEGINDDVVCMELPAPAGWNKKVVLKKAGTPKKNEIVFTAPTGDLLTSRKQLEQYLKSHPGGPPPSEFDWGTGETPRRSARISGKARAAPSPLNSQSPKKKRSKKSSGLKKKDGPEDVQMEDTEKSEKDIAPEEPETEAQKDGKPEKEVGESQAVGADVTGKEAVKENEKEAAEHVPVKDEEVQKEGQVEEAAENEPVKENERETAAEPEPVKDDTEKEVKEPDESGEVEKIIEGDAGKPSDSSAVAPGEKKEEVTDVEIKEAVEPTPVEAGENNGTEEGSKQVIGIEDAGKGDQSTAANVGSDGMNIAAEGDMQNGGHMKVDEVQP